jgi:mannosyltransferase OCH1-like enzyme
MFEDRQKSLKNNQQQIQIKTISARQKTAIKTSRFFIKVFGNLLKASCYPLYYLFPRLRLSLPSISEPLWRKSIKFQIPAYIWQTNFTGRVTLPVFLNYLFNRLMAPGFAYRFMVTEDREAFIKANFDHTIYETYKKIQIGAAQADFWRLLVLYKYGGVYMDIDAHLVWPLHKILANANSELYLKIKTGEISNYFIASAPANRNLLDLINRICQNVSYSTSTNVYDLTGPGVFNDVFKGREVPTRYYLYTCNQGNFTNEYFQYLDKPQGKWTKEQKKIDVVRRD